MVEEVVLWTSKATFMWLIYWNLTKFPSMLDPNVILLWRVVNLTCDFPNWFSLCSAWRVFPTDTQGLLGSWYVLVKHCQSEIHLPDLRCCYAFIPATNGRTKQNEWTTSLLGTDRNFVPWEKFRSTGNRQNCIRGTKQILPGFFFFTGRFHHF